MVDATDARALAVSDPATPSAPRHSAVVRVTHWIITLSFFALLLSGVEILISHPRFYWGEAGNVLTPPLFTLPIPASRGSIPTGYGFVLPDQNGWSRSLHFQAGWLVFFAGALYLIHGLITRHFARNLIPPRSDLSARSLAEAIRHKPGKADAWFYNAVQRLTYLGVVCVLFPLMFWTGLAMSPGFVAGLPITAELLGGQQSARTIHFFATVLLVLFLAVHVTMIFRAGFFSRMRAMISGRVVQRENA